MVYFAQHELNTLAGISVTASHNPNGWTGLKLSYAPSTTLGPTEISELASITKSRLFTVGSGEYNEQSVTHRYVDFLADSLPATLALKIIVDGGNSISGPIAEMTLRKAGYEVLAINKELDWSFPNHDPDPEILATRVQLQQAVTSDGAECGISLDGDGDRLGITDNEGNIVWPDSVLAILARDILRRHPGSPIIYDVKCSRSVAEVISAHGGNPIMSRTGHSLIKAKMQEVDAPFAGERSGHFFNAADYFGYDDAIYAALWFLKVVVGEGQPVSKIVDSLPKYFRTPTMQAGCPDDNKYSVVDDFGTYAESLGAKNIVRINGIRAEFDNGWLLVRASSNLPALVLLAEASTPNELRCLYEMLRTGLESSPIVDTVWINDPFEGTKSDGIDGTGT
jgi:phosphomannomutase/phosphoglucomutase